MSTTSPAFELGQRDVLFTSPVLTFRRSLVPGFSSFEITQRDVFLTAAVSNYKRSLVSPNPAVLVSGGRVEMVVGILRIPPIEKRFSNTILIDLIFQPATPGDNTREVVYNIPGRLNIRPHLTAPPNGSQHRTGDPVLWWTRTSEAVYYEIQIFLDIDATQRVVRLESLDPGVQAGFQFGRTYYWKVRAVANGKVSDWSETWSFIVPPILPAREPDHDGEGRGLLLAQFQENG